ncbi:MAG: hypothetical protein CM15mP22_2590 [Gammaproteobacteria bacterium]|nr:MAG: hypothetical protein CM15mP22_2590 [Gammaproteobacteria bacterium]
MNHNLPSDSLLEIALKNGEGTIVKNGALVVTTGKRTGRSPADKFIVSDAKTKEVVNWGEDNQPIEPQFFEKLWDESEEYLKNKPLILPTFTLELAKNTISRLE